MRVVLGLLLAAAMSLPASAQVHPQRIPPGEPLLQFAGRTDDGELTFIEATTFGRWQGRGFGWLLVMRQERPQPIWIRSIVDCDSSAITDDYIVWLDGDSLHPIGSTDQGFPMSERTHPPAGDIEQAFADAACSGRPLAIGEAVRGVRATIDFIQREDR